MEYPLSGSLCCVFCVHFAPSSHPPSDLTGIMIVVVRWVSFYLLILLFKLA